MDNRIQSGIYRQIDDGMLARIMDIRNGHYHPDAYDCSYWNGGIQNPLDAAAIRAAHDDDPTSRFALVCREDMLAAYARFSVNYRQVGDMRLSKLHIIASAKSCIGRPFSVAGSTMTAGEFLLRSVLRECAAQGSSLLLSEICIFPYPNLPSLDLHKRLGFVSIADNVRSVGRAGGKNIFIHLGKVLDDSFPPDALLDARIL